METRKSPLPSRRHSESLPTTAAQTTLSRHDHVISVSTSCAESLVLNNKQRLNQPVQSAASPIALSCTRKHAMEKRNGPKSAPDHPPRKASAPPAACFAAPSSPHGIPASRSTQQGSPRPYIKSEDIDCLRTASLDPPITKESLSQLDLNAIVENARLRHDLNFEPDIVFRPNMYGERGQQKKLEEKRYFEALAIEFEIYIQRHSWRALQSGDQRNASCTISHVHAQQHPPARLPRMLVAIRDVIKTLVPNDKWPAVDEQFDVDLRMQELAYGAFDVARLIEWLGKLLLGSCPPLRDQMVLNMVSNTRRGVEAQDARQVVSGLQELFAVLETMKLDVANSQIRHLRFYLLDDSIEFEQKHIAKYIAAGWDVTRDRRWFECVHPYPETVNRYWMFKEGFLNMITVPITNYPRTFMSDYERLRQLQLDFRICHHQLACSHAFSCALHLLGFSARQSEEVHRRLLQRVLMIATNLGREFNFGPHPDIVLEIVREAYILCDICRLPDARILGYVENLLKQTSNPALTLHRNIVQDLRNELRTKINSELELISSWTPLQILNHLHAPTSAARYNRDGVGLDSLARRSAQMIVLHWKVWAPILYDHPNDHTVREPTDATDAAVAIDAVSERMSSLGLEHQTRNPCTNQRRAGRLSPSTDETSRLEKNNQNGSSPSHTEDSTTEDEKETAA